ncbi:MAG TPA: hypothetical protein VFB62_09410 [Polyangiaceae bacterium]|jgi:hypothetical protein|nr:hypothetical protein [Polyangiaceae bacterium]
MAKQRTKKTAATEQPNKLATLLERIVDDQVLRRELAQDPVATLARLGIEVDHDEATLLLERAGVSTTTNFAPPYVPVGPAVGGD